MTYPLAQSGAAGRRLNERPAEVVARYMAIDPQKYARNAVRTALGNGTLVRGTCARASDGECQGGIEAHHHLGYHPSLWLAVEWLCIRHHRRAHRALKCNSSATKPSNPPETTNAPSEVGASQVEHSQPLTRSV